MSRTQRLTDEVETPSAAAIAFTDRPLSTLIDRAAWYSFVFTRENVAARSDALGQSGLPESNR